MGSRETLPLELVQGIVVVSYNGPRAEGSDLFHGEGEAIMQDGSKYVGRLLEGELHGEGRMEWPDGCVYEGTFKRNTMEGRGKVKWADESVYEGEFVKGLREGNGVFSHAKSRVTYKGQFKGSKRHGNGILQDGEKCWYKGEWKNGKRCGQGEMLYKSGTTYKGEWKDDKPDGIGTMVWPSKGERYEGSWKQGKQSGKGKYFWDGPSVHPGNQKAAASQSTIPRALQCNHYDGEWDEGMRNGVGTFHYADGASYHGEWVNNRKHGQGVFAYADGRVYEGRFDSDRMVDQEPESDTGLITTSGSVGVELKIFDLVPGLGPKARRVLREVENVLLRWNKQLRSVYSACQAIPPLATESKENADTGHLFIMKTWQFWALCRACDIVDTSVTLATVNRVLATIRASHGQQAPGENIHARNQPVLFREFIEAIVRLAHEKYATQFPDLTLAMLVSCIITSNVNTFLERSHGEITAACQSVSVEPPGVTAAFRAVSVAVDMQEWDCVANPKSILQGLSLASIIVQDGDLGRMIQVPADLVAAAVSREEPVAAASSTPAASPRSQPEVKEEGNFYLALSYDEALGAILDCLRPAQGSGALVQQDALRAEMLACQFTQVIASLVKAMGVHDPRLARLPEEFLREKLCSAVANFFQ